MEMYKLIIHLKYPILNSYSHVFSEVNINSNMLQSVIENNKSISIKTNGNTFIFISSNIIAYELISINDA